MGLSRAVTAWSLVGFFLARASAHLGECVASTEAGLDYQVSVAEDFTFHWSVDTTNEDITFQVVYEGDAWVSVGFSADGDMVPSDAVIGLPDEGSVLEYDLTSKVLAGVTESATQEISAASVTQSNNATTLVFTRPLSPVDSGKLELSAAEGEEVTFIWASGTSNELGQHDFDARGAVTVGDLFCAETTEGDDHVEDGDDGLGAAGASSCESSDPEFDFEVAPADGLALFWRVVDGDSVSVKAVYQSEGYLAIGFSDSGRMPGSDAVVGLPDEGTALEYDMDNYGTPVEASDQEITDATITQSAGETTLTFTRPLEPVGDGKQILSLSEDSVWLYAWGGSNSFQQHASEGAFSLSLTSCNLGDAGTGATDKEYAHGWLMVLGWTVCFPVGIMYARFSSSFAELGFPAHRMLQTLGAVLSLGGFFTAIVFTEDFGLDHFDNSHAMSGLVLTVLMMLQVVAAVFRPPKGNPSDDAAGQGFAQKPTKIRLAWRFLHRGFGYILVVWAVLQCYSGLDLLNVKDRWTALYTALVVLMAVAFVLLQLSSSCRARNKNGVRQLEQPQLAVDAGVGTRSGARGAVAARVVR